MLSAILMRRPACWVGGNQAGQIADDGLVALSLIMYYYRFDCDETVSHASNQATLPPYYYLHAA